MIVSFIEERGLIYIEGIPELFPAKSLTANADNDLISIFLFGGAIRVFGPDRFSFIQDENGQTFPNVSQTLTYLLKVFNQEKAQKVIEWISPSALTAWDITHDLGYYPRVTVIDTAGSEIVPDIDNISLNRLVINFAFPVSGTAYLT